VPTCEGAKTLFVNALPEHVDLARAVARSAYRAGASYVDVRYVDPHIRRAQIELAPDETLSHSPDWLVERAGALEGNDVASIAGEG
jgi:aminopeptidase